jgi:hypothetical protein
MVRSEQVLHQIEAVDCGEGIPEQLVSLLLLVVELVHHLEVEILVVELGDETGNQYQSLGRVDSVVFWIFDCADDDAVELLAVPIRERTHHLLQCLDFALVILLLARMEVV